MTFLISVNETILPDTCKKRRINDNGDAKFAVTNLVTIVLGLGLGSTAKYALAFGNTVKPIK